LIYDPVPLTKEVLDQADANFSGHSFVPVNKLRMVTPGVLDITDDLSSSKELALNPDALGFLHNWCQIPPKFMTLIQEDKELCTANWNYFLNKYSASGDVRALKAVVKNDQVVGWTRRGWQGLPPSTIIKACVNAIDDAGLDVSGPMNGEPFIALSRNTLEFFVTSPAMRHQFESGIPSDLHHFSVGIKYAALGDSVPEVRVQGHRRACGNLMNSYCGITGSQFRVFDRDSDQLLARFAEFTRKGAEFVKMVFVPQVEKTLNRKFNDVMNELREMMEARRLPAAIQALVYEAFEVEPLGGTMYHVINSFTRAANSDRCADNWREPLRQLAADISINHVDTPSPDRCPTCHHVVTDPHVHA